MKADGLRKFHQAAAGVPKISDAGVGSLPLLSSFVEKIIANPPAGPSIVSVQPCHACPVILHLEATHRDQPEAMCELVAGRDKCTDIYVASMALHRNGNPHGETMFFSVPASGTARSDEKLAILVMRWMMATIPVSERGPLNETILHVLRDKNVRCIQGRTILLDEYRRYSQIPQVFLIEPENWNLDAGCSVKSYADIAAGGPA